MTFTTTAARTDTSFDFGTIYRNAQQLRGDYLAAIFKRLIDALRGANGASAPGISGVHTKPY